MDRGSARVALACLCHPLSLVAMAVLALNDHLWKGHGPGWLTGKLSDFAGLFFFPFFVAAIFSRVAPRRRRFILPIGRVAFAVTALWFVGIKTAPSVRDATQWLAAQLVGSSSIVLDPWDCLALVVLWPAWTLYRRMHTKSLVPLRRRWHAFVFSSSALLCVATSYSNPRVTGIVPYDGHLYAVIHYNMVYEDGLWSDDEHFVSSDGMTWEPITALPPEVLSRHQQKTEVVDPRDHRRIFRLAEQSIEKSTDGGSTWDTEWTVARDRQRFAWSQQPSSHVDEPLRDIAFMPDNPDILVVAANNQGVVTRDADGNWHRRGVGALSPTPLQGPPWSLSAFALAIAFIAWILLSEAAWGTLTKRAVQVAVEVALLTWLSYSLTLSGLNFPDLVILLFMLTLLLALTAAIPRIRRWIAFRREQGALGMRLSRVALLGAFACGLVTEAALALWSYGWVPMAMMFVLTAGVVAVWTVSIWRVSAPARATSSSHRGVDDTATP